MASVGLVTVSERRSAGAGTAPASIVAARGTSALGAGREPVNILVAGTGGVGGYYGARLQQAGHDVWFMARGPNLQALRQRGLQVRSDHGDLQLPSVRAVETGREAGPVDAVLFCVKTYDNAPAADAAAGAVGPGTVVCSLQNGVENEEFLRRRFPEAVILGGTARIEAFLEEPGVVVQRGGFTDVTVGAFDSGDRPAAEALAGAFQGTPVQASVVEDITRELWLKLLIIAGIGGVTAYCRCTIGEIRQDEGLLELMARAMKEVREVAAARGIELAEGAPQATMAAVRTALKPEGKSSMCRDVEAGKPLEVEAINGAVVRFGEEAGIETPANREITERLLPLHRRALAARSA